MFRYRDNRDLTGFVDGTENPVGEEAERAAIIAEGPLVGGSFAFVQRFLHDRAKFEKLSAKAQDDVIGRTKIDNVELEDAPAWAHVKRVDQKAFDPPMTILRKSMPWGDVSRAGLQFLAFTHDLARIDTLLARMVGSADGVADSLLSYTRAETGAYYFCPASKNGRPDLRALTG
jgi:putative iron-dependent peroxidase